MSAEHVQSAAWWYDRARREIHAIRSTIEHATWCETHASEWTASTWYAVLVDLSWALHWRAVARAARAGVPVQRWPKLPDALRPPGPTRSERVATCSERQNPKRVRASVLRARQRNDQKARHSGGGR